MTCECMSSGLQYLRVAIDMLNNETMNMIPARHAAIMANHMNAVIYNQKQ